MSFNLNTKSEKLSFSLVTSACSIVFACSVTDNAGTIVNCCSALTSVPLADSSFIFFFKISMAACNGSLAGSKSLELLTFSIKVLCSFSIFILSVTDDKNLKNGSSAMIYYLNKKYAVSILKISLD